MKKYVRCKVCNYIMEENDKTHVCPACGVPMTAFEPYKMTISEKRKFILDQHLHPIILHFPQGFAIFAFLLIIFSFFVGGDLKKTVLTTESVLVMLLPFTVMMGFASGLFDGKVRFKKLKTPILIRKMILGIAFFVLSIVAAAVQHFYGNEGGAAVALLIILLFNNLSAAALGKMGAKLLDARMPG